MRIRSILVSLWLLCGAAAAPAQTCRGDVDASGGIDAADVQAVVLVLFDLEGFDAPSVAAADVDRDGAVSVSDIVSTLKLVGSDCPGFTPTPSRTPTRTGTPTPTRTSPPTATPTAVCVVTTAALGTTNGSLTTGDCLREFRREVRRADQYSFSGTPGQAVKLELAATGFTQWVRVLDANGFFVAVEGASPVEFMVTTERPYTLLITSNPSTESQLGTYAMTLTSRSCPVAALRTQVTDFDGSECPDPSYPTLGTRQELADTYEFTVLEPLTLVSIQMRQNLEDSLIDPQIAIYGPGGYEVFPAFQADDQAVGGFGFDALARFLAIEPGVYRVVATGGGCDPEDDVGCGYRMVFSTATCNATLIANIPATSRQAISGVHYGDTTKTRCAAPLPLPGLNENGEPEIASPADVYTFDGTAGEVISIEMESEDEPQLYLLGPAASGNPLVAQDGGFDGAAEARIGLTLPATGRYTLVAAIKNYLFAPDPEDPEDEGDTAEYTLFVQKCPVAGSIDPTSGAPRSDRFGTLDCIGAGGVPVRSYAVQLDAGRLLNATLTSAAADTRLSLIGPDGSRLESDDDPYVAGATDARIMRLAPLTGRYFLEVSTSPDVSINLGSSPPFTLRGTTCGATAAAPGVIDGTFADNDCSFENGRRYDVWSFDSPPDAASVPRVASFSPGAGTCALGVLSNGPQVPAAACSGNRVEVPLTRIGRHGLVVAATDANRRGAYSVQFARCGLTRLSYGETQTQSLDPADCPDGLGKPSDWYLFAADLGLARLADGFLATLQANFPALTLLAGPNGAVLTESSQPGVSAEDLFTAGSELQGVIAVQGKNVSDRGSHSLSVRNVERRQ